MVVSSRQLDTQSELIKTRHIYLIRHAVLSARELGTLKNDVSQLIQSRHACNPPTHTPKLLHAQQQASEQKLQDMNIT